MAAPAFSAWAGPTRGTTGTISQGLPAHAAGNLLIAIVSSTANASVVPSHSTPTGWTLLDSRASSAGTIRERISVFWKRATSGGESTPQSTVTPTGATACHHQMVTITVTGDYPAAPASPFETPEGGVSTTNAVSVARTITGSGRLHILAFHHGDDNPTDLTHDAAEAYDNPFWARDPTGIAGSFALWHRAGLGDGDDDASITMTAVTGGNVGTVGVSFSVIHAAVTHDISGTVIAAFAPSGNPQAIHFPSGTVTSGWTLSGRLAKANSLKEAAATRGIHFGQGWGPPPWSDSETIGTNEYNSFALPGTMGTVWLGDGLYDWDDPDFGKAWADSHPGTHYASTQLFYGIFIGQNNNTLVPDWLRGADTPTEYGVPTVTPAQLTQHMQNFLTAYMQRYPDMSRIEICNELATHISGDEDFFYDNSSIGAAGGKTRAEYVDQLARWAKAINPNAEVFYNDQGGENGGTGGWAAYYQDFYDFVVELVALESPLDGLGFQCHMDIATPPNFNTIQTVIRQYRNWGFHVHITEMGVRAPVDGNGLVSQADQLTQAAHYRSLIEAFLLGVGEPGWLLSISTWGTRDRADLFDPGGMIFDVNSQRKEAWWEVVNELVEPWPLGLTSGAVAKGWGWSTPAPGPRKGPLPGAPRPWRIWRS